MRTVLGVLTAAVFWGAAPGMAQEPTDGLSAPVREALQLVASGDRHQQQLGFLRLEALREPATLAHVQPYLRARQATRRAAAMRAVAALQGLPAVPMLLEGLAVDRHATVRLSALQALEPFEPHDPQILPALIDALRDRSPLVRMGAVDAVSRIKKAQAREAVLTHAKIEHRRDVRRVLTVALQRLRSAP